MTASKVGSGGGGGGGEEEEEDHDHAGSAAVAAAAARVLAAAAAVEAERANKPTWDFYLTRSPRAAPLAAKIKVGTVLGISQ